MEGVETFELNLALNTAADYFGIKDVHPNKAQVTIQDQNCKHAALVEVVWYMLRSSLKYLHVISQRVHVLAYLQPL